MIFALLFLLFLVIGAIVYFINRKFKFFDNFGGFMLGLVFVIILAILFSVIMMVIAVNTKSSMSAIPADAVFFIGASQLVYIIPIILILIRNKQYDMMKGVITGAVLIALLNGSCFMFVMPNIGRIGG